MEETTGRKKIMLAIPSRDGMVSHSNITAIQGFYRLNMHRAIDLIPYLGAGVSDITTFRNQAANVCLEKQMDAVLFIDNDIDYSEQALLKAFWTWENTNYHVIAGAYPKKAINTNRILELTNSQASFQTYDELLSASHRYTVNDQDFREVMTFKHSPWHQDPFAQKRGDARLIGWEGTYTGAGFLLIPAKTLIMIMQECLENMYYDSDHEGSRYPFFNHLQNPDGLLLGEDYSFCQRNLMAGGKLLILDTRISHRGNYVFQGDISATFKHQIQP